MKTLPLINAAAIVLLCLATAGCVSLSEDSSRFFAQDVEKQHEEFATLPIEVQYELFRTALAAWHPPHTRFAIDLAREGEKAVPLLLEKLEQEPWDYAKERIIFVLQLMTRIYDVPLNEDDQVMMAVENALESMLDPTYKKQGIYSLSLIAQGQLLAD